jgi:hypothetical protein
MALTREQILAACPRQVVKVHVPALGGDVCLRALSGLEAAQIHGANLDNHALTRAYVTASLCDETGARIFAAADADALFDKPPGVLNELITAALSINRLTESSQADAKKG